MGLILTSVELSLIEKTRCIYQQRMKEEKHENKQKKYTRKTKIHTHKHIEKKMQQKLYTY